MDSAFQVLRVLAEVGPKLQKVGVRVAEALNDGRLDAEDAEQFAIDAAKEIDLKVKVHGKDVIDEDAEIHLLAFISIVTANTIAAKKA